MDLIRTFTADQYAGALESWAYLGLDGKRPAFSSPFGDVFFEAADGWWFLDIMGGRLTREWASVEDLQAALDTQDGQEGFLMSALAGIAAQRGFAPTESQILAFATPPMLGGQIHPDNLEVADMEVTVNLHGQIHEQIKDFPPGTPIGGVTIG